MAQPRLEFWFEFASTYSYLSAMRLTGLAQANDVDVIWRPFLLGPIFKSQDWPTSPFNLYPAKGRYMWRDMARRAEQEGLVLHRPDPFPQNGLVAARVALTLPQGPQMQAFCQQVYLMEFAQGRDISDPEVIAECALKAGLRPEIVDSANNTDTKRALRSVTEEAQERGIFGAPSFLVGDELFWGDDHLEDALAWAVKTG